MTRRPLEAAHAFANFFTALGPERIVWGTDSTWYGSPQPLIDAFRAFQIPSASSGARLSAPHRGREGMHPQLERTAALRRVRRRGWAKPTVAPTGLVTNASADLTRGSKPRANG